jgi:hypothetical protein
MSQALEPARKRTVRLPVGLLLSIGSEKPERGPGRPIDHFRPKEGQLEQFAAEAKRFTEVYGDEPKQIGDIYFLANEVPAVFDIRLLAFSQSGIRGVGDTNFAEINDEAEFEERIFGAKAFEDGFTFFPKDVSEVRPEMRETWEGEPVHGELTGRNDARVDKLDVKYVASLEFCLPEVMGLGKVARISTSGRASIRNLWKGLWTEWFAFNGNLSGPMFRLTVRPRSTQRFEKKEKKMVQTTVFELVLDTPHTVAELREALSEHRKAFGVPSKERLRLEGRALSNALALPAPAGEEQTREEVVAETPDWLLNKIASMESELEEAARRGMLLGVFGVEESSALTPEQAERYWGMLEAAMPAEPVEGEIVNGNGDEHEGSASDPAGDSAAAEPSSEAEVSTGETAGASPVNRPGSDALPPVEEDSGAETGPSDTEPSAAPGDSTVTAGTGLGDEEPVPSAPEPLPGEPVAGAEYVDPLDAAAALIVPIGGNRDSRLDAVDDGWLKWALHNAHQFGQHTEFYSGLEFFVQHRKPEIWAEVRG